jgi:hypothetical protein
LRIGIVCVLTWSVGVVGPVETVAAAGSGVCVQAEASRADADRFSRAARFVQVRVGSARRRFSTARNWVCQGQRPGVQIGTKVDVRADGGLESVYVAVRPVYPARGCLDCAGLIDPFQLQREQRTEEETAAQNYVGAAAGEPIVDPIGYLAQQPQRRTRSHDDAIQHYRASGG